MLSQPEDCNTWIGLCARQGRYEEQEQAKPWDGFIKQLLVRGE